MPQAPSPGQVEQANAGMVAMQNRDFARAADIFDRLGEFTIQHFELARAAGYAHASLNHHQRAVDYLYASLALKDDQADVHAAMGDILAQSGDGNTAIRHLAAATRLTPEVPELHHKLGLAQLRMAKFEDAADSMQKAVSLRPDFLPAQLGLARALTELEQFEAADSLLASLQEQAPDTDAIAFRLGKLREKQLRYEDAAEYFREAAKLSQDAPEVCEALGLVELAMGRPDAALATFERGLQREPTNAVLLAHESSLRFEMAHEKPFEPYQRAIGEQPSSLLQSEYIQRLIQAGELDTARAELARHEQAFGKDPLWMSQMAQLHAEEGHPEEMRRTLEQAPEDNPQLMMLRAQALIGCGDIERAEALLMALLRHDPRDQYLLAMLSTCYRLTKPDAYRELVDYDNLIKRSELAVPTGYNNLQAFNDALRASLERLHITRVNPLSQSVVGGLQTPGNLLLQPDPVIQSLREAIHATLQRELGEAFFSRVGDASPVNLARNKQLHLQAAWSIHVTEGGYHRTHVHSRGWYSSAYYVSVPDEILPGKSADNAGALAFGRPGITTPVPLEADRILPPKEGILTLFPSYVWHETRPYKSSAPRVVVAFDAVPKA